MTYYQNPLPDIDNVLLLFPCKSSICEILFVRNQCDIDARLSGCRQPNSVDVFILRTFIFYLCILANRFKCLFFRNVITEVVLSLQFVYKTKHDCEYIVSFKNVPSSHNGIVTL